MKKIVYITKEFISLIKERKLLFLSPLFAIFIIIIMMFFFLGANTVISTFIYAGF